MNFLVDGRTYLSIDYRDYIPNNLSRYGCAIFKDCEKFDFKQLTNYIEKLGYLGNVDAVAIQVYDFGEEQFDYYYTFVNDNKISAFGFFDILRLACNRFGLSGFYGCDLETDKIYDITITDIKEYGRLKDLKNILNLHSTRTLARRQIKWCPPSKCSKYLCSPQVFRDEPEREFYNLYLQEYQSFSIFYSLEECKDYYNAETNSLEFDTRVILDFDIDEPSLTIKADTLKTRNLNVKELSIKNEEFCSHLRCKDVKAGQVYAEGIECERLDAGKARINFKYGIQFSSFKLYNDIGEAK